MLTRAGVADGLSPPHAQPQPQQQLLLQSGAAAAAAAAAAMAESRAALLQLLAPLMEGVRHLAAYRCSEALASLSRLPLAQARTAWVMCAMGTAHFESMNYARAAQVRRLGFGLDGDMDLPSILGDAEHGTTVGSLGVM